MPQSSKHVEQLAPELERIVSPSEPIQDLADGFGGAQGPAEGTTVVEGGPLSVAAVKLLPGDPPAVVLASDQPALEVAG